MDLNLHRLSGREKDLCDALGISVMQKGGRSFLPETPLDSLLPAGGPSSSGKAQFFANLEELSSSMGAVMPNKSSFQLSA